jgi:hypothetical protein
MHALNPAPGGGGSSIGMLHREAISGPRTKVQRPEMVSSGSVAVGFFFFA